MDIKQLEKDLWESADDLRANSKLTATEYAQPVLGLIFLSHASSRLHKLIQRIEQEDPTAQKMAHMVKTVPNFPQQTYETYIKNALQGLNALYLEPEQRFSAVAQLAGGEPLGAYLDAIMRDIETSYPILTDALPKTYSRFEPDLLQRLVRVFNRSALTHASGDVFGKIYEYFLNKFAMSGAQEGGEFFTPPSLVKTIVNFIEPDHGVIFDPACGSAGMFIQTTHFLEDHHLSNTKIRFAGQEKSENNKHLAVMNMVVHGLDATGIKQGNTFYERREELVGLCDFVMANPPFNVDAVDATRCQVDVISLPTPSKEQPNISIPTALDYMQAAVTEKKRLPFGLCGVTKRKSTANERTDGGADKNDVVSNANSLWIQYFYSYLNATGRAGFVMASSASDAGGRDREIRQQLVETGHVDLMVSIGPKFFYTRSLPCTLWFFDKGKPAHRLDQVLMLDARSVYTVVSAKSHVFSDAQLAALTAVVWLKRGEHDKYNQLLASYLNEIAAQLNALPNLAISSSSACRSLATLLNHFTSFASLDELNKYKAKKDKDGNDIPAPVAITQTQWQDYQQRVQTAFAVLGIADNQATNTHGQLNLITPETTLPESFEPLYTPLVTAAKQISFNATDNITHPQLVSAFTCILAEREAIQAMREAIIQRHQGWLALVDEAEALRATQSKHWDKAAIKAARLALLPSAADAREDERTIHDGLLACIDVVLARLADIEWLHSRFAEGMYADVLGLCKLVSRAEIAANDYSLTAGRYVGVVEAEDDLNDFAQRMREIHVELAELDKKAATLGQAIEASFKELLG